MLQIVAILLASSLGFFTSYYIGDKKKKHQKLICFVGKDCNKVVNSKYSSTFGISNELLGMWYYGFFIIISFVFLVNPLLYSSELVLFPIKIISAIGIVFVVYVLYIQAFVLKSWCEWCLASSVASIIIFLIIFL